MQITVAQANTAYRVQRTFDDVIYIMLQMKTSPANYWFAHDQGSAQNFDGFLLDMTVTNPPTGIPFVIEWQGELWYISDTTGAIFILVPGTETSQRKF
jgi:hypothetical protein